MLWLLAFATLVIAIAGGYAVGTRRLGAGPSAPALPEAPTPLQMRLLELDAAIMEVRAACTELTANVLQVCAAHARHGRSAGPGTRVFERLIASVLAIDEQDRRALEDAGLDPRRILAALDSPLPPAQWVEHLEQTLDYVRSGIRKLPERRYG